VTRQRISVVAGFTAFLLLLAVLAIGFPALAYLGLMLIGVQPTLKLLGAALLLRRRMPLTFLLVERVEFFLQGVVTRPGRFVRISHGRFLLIA